MHTAGMLILFQALLGILLLDPLFFFHGLVIHAFHTSKILVHCSGTLDSYKR